ncbi:response regulator containing a CheY-like receiver domain and an HTH DNA-binding domain [Aequorivita sublithincola DSM 14238]|uniref:Response regulator containing a CheY-like receiver domain and an HTH DNA-binding domain n=2 Tax=Aequorivita TaxID=153265 RepID=I3YWR2_AEQSU|nr:response regulator containing a CheY-like receiver domain and an HTH DNA-binding domain [Aequorivita sublithincola DSM 14238]
MRTKYFEGMTSHTQQEKVFKIQHFAYKMRNLYTENPELFNEVVQYIPYIVHTNRKDNLDIIYANEKLLQKGPELEKLVELGGSYLPEISCNTLLKSAVEKAKIFAKINDGHAVCNYIQYLQVNKVKKYVYSSKLLLDENLYFNLSVFTEEMGMIDKMFNSVFGAIHQNPIKWQQFQSLTKMEKKLIKLFADGHSNNELAEMLFISPHTVQTHRRNIYSKLSISKAAELIKISLVLEIL